MTVTSHLLTAEEVGWDELAALNLILEAVGFGCPLPLPAYNTHRHVKVCTVRHERFFFSIAPLSALLNPAAV